jgi:hypothetical protein
MRASRAYRRGARQSGQMTIVPHINLHPGVGSNPGREMGSNDIIVTASGAPSETGDLDMLIRDASKVYLSDGNADTQTVEEIDTYVEHEQLPGDTDVDTVTTIDQEIAFLKQKNPET